MAQLDQKKLNIQKYKVTKLGDKEMHQLWEQYLSHTNRYERIGTRSWQGAFRITGSTRTFVLTGYLNEWFEPSSKIRNPLVPDNRLVAILPMTKDLGWFWFGADGNVQFPPRSKSQIIEAPGGFLDRLTAAKDGFVEVKGDKAYVEWPATKGLLGMESRAPELAEHCIGIMQAYSSLFVIGK